MKIHYSLVFVLLLAAIHSYGQVTYHDAKAITQKYLSTKSPLAFKTDDTTRKELVSMLRNYMVDSLKNSRATDGQILKSFKNNPFFGSELQEVISDASSIDVSGMVSTATSQLGGMNVGTIVDGLAQFLIERANEEINVLFFERFKKILTENEEFGVLFPTTREFVKNTEPYQYEYLLQSFREAFRKDIQDLTVHAPGILETGKMKALQKKYPEIKGGLLAVSIVGKLSTGEHPADILEDLAKINLEKVQNVNVYSFIKIASTLSAGIRSTDPGKIYVDYAELETNLKDPAFRRIFLGLLYEQLKAVKFQINGNVYEMDLILQTIQADEKILIGYYKNVHDLILKVDKSLEKLKTSASKPTYEQYISFFEEVLDGLEIITDVNPLLAGLSVKLELNTSGFQDYFRIARTGIEIYRNVNEKKYSVAIFNFGIVFHEVTGRDIDKQIEEIVRVGESAQQFIKDHEELIKYALTSHVNIKEYWGTQIVSLSLLIGGTNIGTKDNVDFDKLQKLINDSGLTPKEKDALRAFLKYFRPEIERALLSKNPFFDSNVSRHINLIDSLATATRLGISNRDFQSKVLKAVKEYYKKIQPSENFLTDFLKYGTFMAEIVQAKDAEEVKNALKAVALPPGSYTIKHVSDFNIALNGYLGYGLNYNNTGLYSQGIYAPIGLSFSHGFSSKVISSGTLFTSLIDIGAVVGYRLSNGSSDALKQDITLESIFSPSAQVIFDIAKTPIAVCAGWRMTPKLSYVDTAGNNVIMPTQNTFNLSFLIDIPIFNFYTRPKN